MKKHSSEIFRGLLRRFAVLLCLAGFASGARAETGVATLTVGLAEGQHFKIRGATTCQLRYEGEGSALAKGRDIVLTLPPFFKFVTTPLNGEGYTVEYRPVKRRYAFQIAGGVPLPAKYYTADYGTVEANAAELLAFAPSNLCEQLTLHLDNVAASRQFNLSFAIQVDPSWSSWNPTDPKTGQELSMSGITAYRQLGELMVLAGAHCDAIPLNICAWVVNAGEDEAVCEAVFHGTSRITNEDGTEPFESELSLPSKGPPNVESFIQHGYNLYNVRPRFDSVYADLVEFEPWYYPYSDIQIFFPVPSDASMSMRYFGDGSRNTYYGDGSWGELIGISLAEVEAVCANYPVVEHDGKKYWLVYDLNQDAGYPRGQTQIDAADSIQNWLAYVLPHRDTLLPGVPIEFGDVLISYTHKGRLAEFERVLTIDPFTPEPCPPSMYYLPYNATKGGYLRQAGVKRPQGMMDTYQFSLLNADYYGWRLPAAYRKAHVRIDFPWEIAPRAVTFDDGSSDVTRSMFPELWNYGDYSPPNSLEQQILPTSVTYFYHGEYTARTLPVTGRELVFPDDDRHIERIVFNYDVLPAFSLCSYLVRAQNMTVDQRGVDLPDRQPCFFTLEMTTDADGGRTFGSASESPQFEPTESQPWMYYRDKDTYPPGYYGVYLVKELDTLQFGVTRFLTNATIHCHGLYTNITDSLSSNMRGNCKAGFSLRKLDNNTKDYANCRITIEPNTDADRGGMSLLSGLQTPLLVVGEDVDRADVTVYSNLRPEGFAVPQPNVVTNQGDVRSTWAFGLAEGEYAKKVVIDLGTVHTDSTRLPESPESYWRERQGQVFGARNSTIGQSANSTYRQVLSFGLLFNDDVRFFKGTDEACAIPDGSLQFLKATFTTDTPAQYINGGGPESYPAAVVSVTLKSRFDAWFGYLSSKQSAFRENDVAKDNAAYQGSDVSFTLGGGLSASSSQCYEIPLSTPRDITYQDVENSLSTFFRDQGVFPSRGRVYFECARGFLLNGVGALFWTGGQNTKSYCLPFEPAGSKRLDNGNTLYWFEADVDYVPETFYLSGTLSPSAPVGTYPLIANWGWSMDDFAARYLVDGFEGRFSNYACHYEQAFPSEWNVPDVHVLAAGSTAPVKVLETSLDGIVLHPGKDGMPSSMIGYGPGNISLFCQKFREADRTNLLAAAWLVNGTPSLIGEYRAEIKLPRQGETELFVYQGDNYAVESKFSLYLTGPGAWETDSTTVKDVALTYYDDDHNDLGAPMTAAEFARVRTIGIYLRDFNARDLVTLRLPLMTDYDKPIGYDEHAYVTASGDYRNDPVGDWLRLKDSTPVMYAFESGVDFVLRKVVTGDADPGREYSFSITITENSVSKDRVAYTGLGGKADGIQILGYNSELLLKSGEGISIKGLAPYARISVQEKDYSGEGFLTYVTTKMRDGAITRHDYASCYVTPDYGPCEAVFHNHHGPYASLDLTARKRVRDMETSAYLEAPDFWYFQFRLVSVDERGAPLPDMPVETANNRFDNGRRVEFPTLKFTELGDFWFQIDEADIQYDRYICDTSVYRLRVHVYEEGGAYRAIVADTYKVGAGGALEPVPDVVFENIKKPEVDVRYHWVGDCAPSDTQPPYDDRILRGATYVAEVQWPTEEDYVFDGWFVDEACTIPYANGSVLNEDLDLYGYWTKVELADDEVIVSYIWDLWECYDGTPTDVRPPTYDVVKKGTLYRAKPQDPTSQGFTFTGWHDWDMWEDFEEGVITKNTLLLGYWRGGGVALMITDHEDPGDGFVYLAFRPQIRPATNDVPAWARGLAKAGRLLAKRGPTHTAADAAPPTQVELSDRHEITPEKVWVKVPLADAVAPMGRWRLYIDSPGMDFDDEGTYLRSVFGDETGARSVNTFGILKVLSATTNTLVAIPWTWYSAQEKNATHLFADKLVKNTNLTVGDMLYTHVEDGQGLGHYAAWTLVKKDEKGDDDGTNGVWTAINTVAQGADGIGSVMRVGVQDLRVMRGNGVWLVRQHPYDVVDGVKNPVPFWVYGQSVTNAVVTPILPGPGGSHSELSPSVKAHSTILGNPYGEATRINDLVFEGSIFANGVQGDCIVVPTGTSAAKRLYRGLGPNPDLWCWPKPEIVKGHPRTAYDYDVTVPAGHAFWYERRGTEGELKVIWPYRPESQ